MATLHLSTAARNAAANAIVDLIDAGAGAGFIDIYDGVMPATPQDAVTTQTKLARLTWSDPAFGNASVGTATASSITEDSAADATGTATWARVLDSSGAVVFDCDVGTTGASINLNTVSIVVSGAVRLSSCTFTVPSGA